MISDSEDDAFSWDGDDALEARRPTPRRKSATPAPETVQPASVTSEVAKSDGPPASGSTASVIAADDSDTEPEGVGTVTLLLLGIFGGIYLLYTVGWAVGGVGMQTKALFMLPAPLYQTSLWIAVLAPALWFVAVLLMTRGAKDWVRIVALVVGALLLVPWPFVVAGGGL